MINLNELSWQEFLLRTLTLHWLTATVVVLCVAFMIALLRRLNATTRHNIWLLTLVSLALMPLLIFAPRPDISLPTFSLTASVESTGSVSEVVNTPVEMTQVPTRFAEAGRTAVEAPATPDVAEATAPVALEDGSAAGGEISRLTVVKGIFVFWLVGVAFLLRRLWGEYRAARELELQSDSVTPYFDRRFDQLCARLGIDERPSLRFHAGINAPMTVGLMRVWVAIPMTWRETIDDSVFDQTLTHELGHIARKDPVIHTVQRLLSIVLWMYPAVWYVSRQLEVERESACDDWVLTHDGKSATYATNLLDVAESLYLQPQVLAVGCLRSHSQLSRRIQNLLNKSSDHKVSNSWALLGLTFVVLTATLSVSAVVWPDARQLAPPAELAAQISSKENPPASVSPEISTQTTLTAVPLPVEPAVEPRSSNDISRFQTLAQPKPAPLPTPVAKPESVPVVDELSQKSVTVFEDEKGKLTIERHRSGKTKVYVQPAISSKDPVLHAAWNGDKKELKRLATQGMNVNRLYSRSISPRTALEAAVLNGHSSTVETLIKLGVDLSPDSLPGARFEMANPLDLAALAGRTDVARLLLKNDVEPGNDILAAVANNRDARMLELLLRRSQCDCLETEEALIVALKNQDVRSVDVLVKFDAEVTRGALVMAVQNNNTKILNELLKHYDDDIDPATLILAIRNRNSAIVDSLIKAGAEPLEGALTLAVQQRDTVLVSKLLNHGADAEEGALVLAIQQRNVKMIDLLVKAGAPANDGALVMALQQGDIKTVKGLLQHDLDIQEGALVIAIQKQNVEMVRMLLDAGAEVHDGAFVVAAQTGNPAIIDLIRKRSGRSEAELQSTVLRSFDDDSLYKKNYQVNTRTQSTYRDTQKKSDHKNVSANSNKNKDKSKNQWRDEASQLSDEFSISRWPVNSKRISLGFSDTSAKYGSHKEEHEALDFPIKEGSPVYAVADGYVKESRYSKGYGNYVVVDHGNGYKTKYANNKMNEVSKGDYVKAYQQIALVGSTAHDSTGPHLHFELRKNGKKIDPQRVFSSAQ